jgi:hypothetical protein
MRSRTIVGTIALLSLLIYGFFLTPPGKKLIKTARTIGKVATTAPAIAAFRADGRWWDCSHVWDGVPCSVDAVAAIRFTSDEKALKDKLDTLPAPPATLSEADVIALMGAPPRKIAREGPVTKLNWPAIRPGLEKYGDVTISLVYGQLYDAQWLEPYRYFILRRYEVKDIKAAVKGGGS